MLALVLGFRGLKTLAEAILDGGASLTNKSIHTRCARNLGVFLACLNKPLANRAKNECGPIACPNKLAGNVGVVNPLYCRGALDIIF
jgi:hypothetical protein